MSSWSKALTNRGRQLQAKAQAGAQLVYTRMSIGSGTLTGQSLEDMSALITPVKDLAIERLKHPPGSTRALIGATLTNQDVTTGFFLREVGIFATDPDDGEILYMYANAGTTADYITPSGEDLIEKYLNFNVFVGKAANITANIDESLVYVTKPELDEAIAGIHIGDASTTQKGIVQLSNAVNDNSDTKASTPKATKTAYDAAAAAQSAAAAAQAKAEAALPKTGGTITGEVSVVGNAGALDLVGSDHVFMELFPKGRASGRKGYFGFPGADVNNLTITNESTDGDVIVFAKGQNISISDLYKSKGTRAVSDLNNITENGFYDGTNMANAPSADWYYVENIVHSSDPGNWRLQRATHFSIGVTYWRQLRAGTWTAWQTWGGGVKKITRYSASMNSDSSPVMYVTIPAVDMNKTSINLTGFSVQGFEDATMMNHAMPSIYLYNATSVSIRVGEGFSRGRYVNVNFEVIEYS